MEQSQEPVVIATPQLRMNLQSIEDFDAEMDALDAKKASTATTKPIPTLNSQHLPKKPKKTVDPNALAAELQAREELGNENWVSKLNDFRMAHPAVASSGVPLTGNLPGLKYEEIPITSGILRFACTVEISESSQPFGGTAVSFSNKKDAKQFAAKKAIDWLIANNHMPSDGSARFLKLPPLMQMPQSKKAKPVSPSDPSTPSAAGTVKYTTMIPPLCNKLGFSPPRYEIEKLDNTAFWSGYAFFPGNPIIEGKVGEVSNVYGKDNAKLEIAEEVYKFLKDIERQRGEQLDVDDRKRKRSSEGVEVSE